MNEQSVGEEKQEKSDNEAPDEASSVAESVSSDAGNHLAYNDFVYGDVDNVHVSSRISVWWPGEKKYYDGTVKTIDQSRKPYFMEYDDDDEEWTDLRRRYFRFLDS